MATLEREQADLSYLAHTGERGVTAPQEQPLGRRLIPIYDAQQRVLGVEEHLPGSPAVEYRRSITGEYTAIMFEADPTFPFSSNGATHKVRVTDVPPDVRSALIYGTRKRILVAKASGSLGDLVETRTDN